MQRSIQSWIHLYNIYKNTGLMPGPVDNPGVSAIEAAVNPSKTDYLYFVANVENGEVFFAKTYEEHNKMLKNTSIVN